MIMILLTMILTTSVRGAPGSNANINMNTNTGNNYKENNNNNNNNTIKRTGAPGSSPGRRRRPWSGWAAGPPAAAMNTKNI